MNSSHFTLRGTLLGSTDSCQIGFNGHCRAAKLLHSEKFGALANYLHCLNQFLLRLRILITSKFKLKCDSSTSDFIIFKDSLFDTVTHFKGFWITQANLTFSYIVKGHLADFCHFFFLHFAKLALKSSTFCLFHLQFAHLDDISLFIRCVVLIFIVFQILAKNKSPIFLPLLRLLLSQSEGTTIISLPLQNGWRPSISRCRGWTERCATCGVLFWRWTRRLAQAMLGVAIPRLHLRLLLSLHQKGRRHCHVRCVLAAFTRVDVVGVFDLNHCRLTASFFLRDLPIMVLRWSYHSLGSSCLQHAFFLFYCFNQITFLFQ